MVTSHANERIEPQINQILKKMQALGQQLADSGSKAENNPEATWWCKLLARGVCIVAAISKFELYDAVFVQTLFLNFNNHL